MKTFAWIKLLVVAVLTIWVVTACQGRPEGEETTAFSPQSADCRTVAHVVGETAVCEQPQRVVVLGSNLLELLLDLGVQPVGFGDSPQSPLSTYDDPSRQIPYLGNRLDAPLANVGFAYAPSLEAIMTLQPDLILGAHWLEPEYETLSQIAPTLLFNWFEVETNLRAIAQAVNRPEQAEALITKRQQQIAEARQAVASVVKAHPDMLMLMSYDAQNLALITHSRDFCSALVEELGFQLVLPPGIQKSDSTLTMPLSPEILPELNQADSVILLGYSSDDFNQPQVAGDFAADQLTPTKQAWQKNAIAQSLDASKAGRVYYIPAYLCLGLPGPTGTELYLKELQNQLSSAQ